MPKILFFKNTRILRKYLRKIPKAQEDGRRFLSLGILDEDSRRLLLSLSFREAKADGYKKFTAESFLKEYVDLIGRIGKKYGSRLWWATDIASKNRFQSKIPSMFQEFLTVVEAINKRDYDFLIVVNPSWVIIDSLRKFLRDNSLEFEYFQFPRGGWGLAETTIARSRKIMEYLLGALRICWQSAYSKHKLKSVISKVLGEKNSYYVVKSFVYDHSFSADGSYQDIFFGDLLKLLSKSSKVLVYAGISGNFKQCVKKIAKCPNQTILTTEVFLSYRDITRSLVELLFCSIRVKDEFYFFGHDVSGIINNELLRTANGISLYHFLHYYSARRFFKALSVDNFLLIYENNPWEKMCMLAGREHSPRTTIFGYQHAVVPQACANMFNSRDEYGVMPIPDKIFTVGTATKKIIEKYGALETGMVQPACGLRFKHLFNSRIFDRKKEGNILLILEGIEEASKIAAYVIRELGNNKKFNVRIRTHPALSWKYFRKKHGFELSNFTNFHLSCGMDVKADLEWADVVLYWGSTVGVEALSMGRPVIHYNNGSILSYDPLFECPNLKFTADDSTGLVELLEKIYGLSDSEFCDALSKAKEYLGEYFIPATLGNMEGFLEKSRNTMVS